MIKKQIRLLALTLILGVAVSAQSVQDGVKALTSGKVAGAKAIFEKQGDKPEAVYWLVQTYMQDRNVEGAKKALEPAIAAKPNDPWLLVAKGQLQLADKQVNEAKQSFEAALTASKGRKGNDPEVLDAVGSVITREYNNIDKIGDIHYAVQKLEEAKALTEKTKDKTLKARILTDLGDAYRKATPGDGTKAFTAYNDAAFEDETYARSYLRNAMIFKSQKNYDLYLKNIEKAVAADPAFLPAYEELYNYRIGTLDFNAAKDVADKIIANSDPGPWNEYYKAQTLYLNKEYDQAIASGKNILQQMGDNVKPILYKLLAWSYVDKGDVASALPFMETYFAKVDKEDMDPGDYNLKLAVYAGTPGKEGEVAKVFEEGLKSDTTVAGRVKLLQDGAKFFGEKGQRILQGDMLAKILEIKPEPSIRDYFDAGYTGYYQGKDYQKAWTVFDQMRTKYPEQNFGYVWAFNSSKQFDTAYTENKLIPDAEKLAEFSQKDTASDAKNNLFSASAALFPYYVNEKQDRENGLKYLKLAYDAAPNETVKQQLQAFIDQVSQMKPAASGTPPAPAADSTRSTSAVFDRKPAGSGSKS